MILCKAGMAATMAVAGCAAPPAANTDPVNRRMLAQVLPSGIEIIEPFTRVANFDDDPAPDGIELMLQAVNPLNSPCLMMVGTVRIELYEFVPATADNKGRRLEHWNIELTEPEDQERHWNRVTQMYEFRLRIDPARMPPPADRYVVQATYTSPLGEHVSDEFVLQPEVALRTRP